MVPNLLLFVLHLLIAFLQGDTVNHEVDCKETLELFEYQVLNQKATIPDYEELRRILSAELVKHKNEPNYEKLDWQLEH